MAMSILDGNVFVGGHGIVNAANSFCNLYCTCILACIVDARVLVSSSAKEQYRL